MAEENKINPSTGNLDKIGQSSSDITANDLRYLKLDQTTPQTTTGRFTFPALTVNTNTITPTYRLSAYGTAAVDGIQSYMGFEITPVPIPSSPVCVVSAGGAVDVDTWRYYCTYYTALGETPAQISTTYPVVTSGQQTVTVTISTSTDGRVVGRKLYRYSNTLGTQYLVATIAENTSTTYVDTAAKATLASANFYFMDDSTTKYITIRGTKAMHLGLYNLAINSATGALPNLTSGGRNTVFGNYSGASINSGTNNDIFGYTTAASLAGGYGNTLLGSQCAQGLTSGAYNVVIGQNAMTNGNRSNETLVGMQSGRGGAGATANNNVGVGLNSLYSVTSTSYSVGVGSSAAALLTSGAYVTAVGGEAAYNLTTVGYGTHIGFRAGKANTGGYGVFLGNDAGYWETAAKKLFIDYNARASEADGRVKALVYGIFDASTANQYFTINGHFIGLENSGIGTRVPNKTLSVNLGSAGAFSLIYDNAVGTETVFSDFKLDSNGTLTLHQNGEDEIQVFQDSGSEGIVSLLHQSRVRAYVESSQIEDGVWTKIHFGLENWDEQNEWDTDTYTFTAKKAGWYDVDALITLKTIAGTNTNSILQLAFYINGSVWSYGVPTQIIDNGGSPICKGKIKSTDHGDQVYLNARRLSMSAILPTAIPLSC